MIFPHNIPFPIRKTEKLRNTLRIARLSAPNAFRMPIILVRSNIIMSKPEIIVKPATPVISISITHPFISNKSSHANICGLASSTV